MRERSLQPKSLGIVRKNARIHTTQVGTHD